MRPAHRVHLPSGRSVALEVGGDVERREPRARAKNAPLFSELLDLVSADVALLERGATVDLTTLPLRDFHVLRAVATRLGWLAEEPVEIDCRNCEEAFSVCPCASLELGPFLHGELHDDELDTTLDFSVPHAIPTVRLPAGGSASEVTLGDVTVGEAAPLHRALRRRRLAIGDRFVRAMGLVSLGPERDPRRIADALSRCNDAAWGAIGDLFLQAHYLPRLCAVTLCPKCGARNDVDAPYLREFEPSAQPRESLESGESNDPTFPDFDRFAEHARALFARAAGDDGAQPQAAIAVRLVVDAEIPACDDGGEPLLGAYLPPGGDPSAPVGAAEVTVYYRTFRAMWTEEGPYDWKAELEETIEHELEHHAGWRVGHDPMDEAEHEEIARERARLVGRTQVVRGELAALSADFGGFLARTWPIWLIVAIGAFAIIAFGR
jgi:hypothetical protein